jgi:uncharacterized protein
MAEAYHEPFDIIGEEARDYHRAIVSMIEELEAIDWYHQRVNATGDEELRKILEHNRDEEKEHAAMLLEWLRRRDAALSEELDDYLFTEGDISELEEE